MKRILALVLASLASAAPVAAQSRLINLSTRAPAGTGADVLTAGFVIAGGPKTVLIRAVGPTLGSFGLAGTLADPVLTLLDAAGAPVLANDNWSAAQAAAMTAAGAFPLPEGSRDAALVATLNAGTYTAQATPGDGTSTGLAMIEVYEVSAGGATLLNLSSRANVGVDARVAISGLAIAGGTGSRRVLIRAAGPALNAFNLTGTLADPALVVTDAAGTVTYASNDNWGTPTGPGAAAATTLNNAFTAAGAFGFAAGSRDAAVLTELAPGNYTVQVSGVGQTTGLAIVEAYDVTNLTIATTATAPAISAAPQAVTAAAGGPVTLTVTATGSAPLTYQWFKGDTAIPGATAATYAIPALSAADAGTYTVAVTNSAGTQTSPAATLTVTGGTGSALNSTVVAAAQAFHATLSSTQQAAVQLPWSLATARRWSNLPASMSARNGVSWGSLNAAQRTAAGALIAAALSATGTTLFTEMQVADDYLAASGGGSAYGNGNYYVAFIGTPSATGFWVLQLTGHHLTYNLAFNGTYRSPTPLFMAVEPKGAFTQGGTTHDPLQAQRTAVADVLGMLGGYPGATLSGTYTDILFGATGSGGIDNTYPKAYPTAATGRGAAFTALSAADQDKVRTLVRSYVNTQAAEYANDLLASYLSETALAQTYVGFTGSPNVTTSNTYLRIDGPRLWIEFSVQRGIIFGSDVHYHSIWRDKLGDFGGNF